MTRAENHNPKHWSFNHHGQGSVSPLPTRSEVTVVCVIILVRGYGIQLVPVLQDLTPLKSSNHVVFDET